MGDDPAHRKIHTPVQCYRAIEKAPIVAQARKLLVALWKYMTADVAIEGAVMNAA